MADLSDVMSALYALITNMAYPAGVSQPQSVPPPSSTFGMPVRVLMGWPVAEQLAYDLGTVNQSKQPKPAVCNISIYPRPEERNCTRYPRTWQTVSVNTATLTLTISGQTVTVAGSVPNAGANNPHNAMLMVNGLPYVYAVQPTDTLTMIAAALTALIAVNIGGITSSGAVITLPAGARIQAARIGVTGQSAQELRRQERVFQIGIWADSPAHRGAIAGPIDIAIAGTDFLTLSDGFAARIIYKGSPMTDAFEKSGQWRRDLYYTVEYATTQQRSDTEVVATKLNVSPEVSGLSPAPIIAVVDD